MKAVKRFLNSPYGAVLAIWVQVVLVLISAYYYGKAACIWSLIACVFWSLAAGPVGGIIGGALALIIHILGI